MKGTESLYDRTKREEGKKLYEIDFKRIAEDFKLIETAQMPVVIPNEEISDILEMDEISGSSLKKLRRYSASVSTYEFKKLYEAGVLCEKDGIFILADEALYDSDTGLNAAEESKEIFY